MSREYMTTNAMSCSNNSKLFKNMYTVVMAFVQLFCYNQIDMKLIVLYMRNGSKKVIKK